MGSSIGGKLQLMKCHTLFPTCRPHVVVVVTYQIFLLGVAALNTCQDSERQATRIVIIGFAAAACCLKGWRGRAQELAWDGTGQGQGMWMKVCAGGLPYRLSRCACWYFWVYALVWAFRRKWSNICPQTVGQSIV